MNLGLKALAKRMNGGRRYVFRNISKDDSMQYTRQNCRKLIAEKKLIPAVYKGTTRHKKISIKKPSDKQKWIKQVRRLRTIWRQQKKKMLANASNTITTDLRKIYLQIKANKIFTRHQLYTKLKQIDDKQQKI